MLNPMHLDVSSSGEAKLKCVLVGPESVGKTALVSRFCDQTFIADYLLLDILT